MIIVYFLWVIGQNFGQKSQIVRGLREGARGGRPQEVRGLPAEAAKFRAAVRGDDAVVRWLREGARGC